MNERILELVRRADVHILPDDSEYGHTILGLEKFAELIVKECVKKSVEICLDRFQGDCWKNNKEDVEALRCSQDIQRLLPKHFGVE